MFKFLTVHHLSEDDSLWPPLRAAAADHPDRVAVEDALEAEHAVIEPLLEAIGARPPPTRITATSGSATSSTNCRPS